MVLTVFKLFIFELIGVIVVTFNQSLDTTAPGLFPLACRYVHDYEPLLSMNKGFIEQVTLSIYYKHLSLNNWFSQFCWCIDI
jgi:hypothetical protein